MINKEHYIELIERKLIPYWLDKTDRKYGGILNCISNDGESLLSENKYLWSEGRWLYIIALLIENKKYFKNLDYNTLFYLGDETEAFILSYGFDKATYYSNYVTERDGSVISENGQTSLSIYTDCFILLGLSEWAKVKGDKNKVEIATLIMSSIKQRIDSSSFLTRPYDIPSGYSSHGIPMILLNTLDTYISMLSFFSLDTNEWDKFQDHCFFIIWNNHYDREKRVIREYVSSFPDRNERLLDRHLNPGHNLEDLWFFIEYLKKRGDLKNYLNEIVDIAKNVFSFSWDNQYGGIFRFVDISGGRVKGEGDNSSYSSLVLSSWDYKLWWVHSEALYIYALLYYLTGDDELKAMYEKVYEYTFSTFPSQENGEWNQIRGRDGKEINTVVALPVKDPFHIIRDMVKIIKIEDAYDI